MCEILRIELPLQHTYPLRTLTWMGDELVDWASGGRRFRLDRTVMTPQGTSSYHFDAALVSPDAKYIALYERLGTKGLLLANSGEILREINRSYYHAHEYEYPLTFLLLPDGRIGIAHCPHDYKKIEIEDVETARQWTPRGTPPFDFFHARLAVSSDSRYLLSAGWQWHPFDAMQVYDLTQIYAHPDLLDRPCEHRLTRTGVGINNAAFYNKHAILITTNDIYYDATDVEDNERSLLEPDMLAIYDIERKQILHRAFLEEPVGTLMPLGEYVVGFYQHPKLIELKTGKIIMRWEDIFSGEQNSSILSSQMNLPPLAIDRERKRFAVASQESIIVVQSG
jgi:hypothetical protein